MAAAAGQTHKLPSAAAQVVVTSTLPEAQPAEPLLVQQDLVTTVLPARGADKGAVASKAAQAHRLLPIPVQEAAAVVAPVEASPVAVLEPLVVTVKN